MVHVSYRPLFALRSIDWKTVVTEIGGNQFAVSEDVHCCGPPVCPTQACFPPATGYAAALQANCHVFASFVYDEPTCTLNATELDQLLPSYNRRIIIHSRAWFHPHDLDVKAVIGMFRLVECMVRGDATVTHCTALTAVHPCR
jgi:hypothetical protein